MLITAMSGTGGPLISRRAASREPMRWSWKLGQISGIVLSVHATFLLLVVWFTVAYWFEVRSIARVASGVALFLLLFGCVLLHELGHALTAQRFGLTTREITLLPIGGIARLERMPDDPKQSLWITLAGPAVNIVIAVALFVALQVTGHWMPVRQISLTEGPFLERLMLINLSLVAFNMLPAFPMDGGRALRALLATRMDDRRATRIAARLGQAMAIVFAIVGWQANPLLILIALFVWIGATQEAQMAEMRAALSGIPVERAMITAFTTLTPDDRLAAATEYLQHGTQHDFPVMEDGHPAGVLTRDDMLRGLAAGGPQSRVGDAMRRDVQIVRPRDGLDAALRGLDARQCSVALVVQDDQLVGLLTTDAVAEFLRIQAALGISPEVNHHRRQDNQQHGHDDDPRRWTEAEP
jgi:Zn-dependent protease/CBS domain-containing protein